ncbi:MAG: glycine zipper 2TM domain-containing protein [Pseudomonadota bacterium]
MTHPIKFITNSQRGRIHPLVATAAVAVTLVSLVGIAAITGVFPSSNSTTAPVSTLAAPVPMTAPTMAPQAMPAPNQQLAYQSPPQSQSPAYVAIPDPEPVKPRVREQPPKAVKQPAPRPVADDRYSSQPYQQSEYRTVKAPAVCNSCGRVESVVAVNQPAQGSGLGIAAGAVLGGVLGNQVGGGSGKTLATVAGAVAGGYGGNEVEKRARSTTTYQVRVRMEDGDMRTFPQNGPDGFRVGDRVRVVNGALTSRG